MSGLGAGSGYQEVQPISGSVIVTGPATAGSYVSVRITDGTTFLGDGANPIHIVGAVTLSSSITANQGTAGVGAWPMSVASLPLPSGAAQEHITAVSFHAARLTDGAVFYDGAKTGQLPSALVGGRLDTNNGAWFGSTAPTVGQKAMVNSIPVVIASDQTTFPVTVSGTVTSNQGTAAALASAWPVKVTDGTNTMPTMDTVARAAFQKVTDGTNTAAVKAASTSAIATDPALVVAFSQNLPATYGATTGVFAPAASATDVFVITGSASKTVRILRITITASQTTAGQFTVSLIKRSADDTGGTSAAATAVPYDSNNAAGTAVVRSYTVNPTGVGTAVGTVRTEKMFIPATTSVIPTEVVWDFSPPYKQAVTLRGAAQVLAINLGGATLTGGSLCVSVEWTEE
jgi:hypothetical protein